MAVSSGPSIHTKSASLLLTSSTTAARSADARPKLTSACTAASAGTLPSDAARPSASLAPPAARIARSARSRMAATASASSATGAGDEPFSSLPPIVATPRLAGSERMAAAAAASASSTRRDSSASASDRPRAGRSPPTKSAVSGLADGLGEELTHGRLTGTRLADKQHGLVGGHARGDQRVQAARAGQPDGAGRADRVERGGTARRRREQPLVQRFRPEGHARQPSAQHLRHRLPLGRRAQALGQQRVASLGELLVGERPPVSPSKQIARRDEACPAGEDARAGPAPLQLLHHRHHGAAKGAG
eukprot:scaffold1394_cov109-Isochrysis_galbana.AAC.30